MVLLDERYNRIGTAVANFEKDYLWWKSPHQAHLMKVPILRKDRISIILGKLPNNFIRRTIKTLILYMGGGRKKTANLSWYTIGEILIQQ